MIVMGLHSIFWCQAGKHTNESIKSLEIPIAVTKNTQPNLSIKFNIARSKINRAADYTKANHDLRIALRTFSKGDFMWFRNERRNKNKRPKLQNGWFAPCVVLQKLNDLNYRIQLNGSGNGKYGTTQAILGESNRQEVD